ncbi:hypothetical protein LIER_26626 [Lithospermum erythrorhizon]|uniref:Uncharacterized protein n=1 Tax=Lithospermum erythrorhizon TaxID=34254 RepID=A0AAV3RD94_LITER
MPHLPLGSLNEGGADSVPRKKQDAFQASRPLILEWVAKDFDKAHDPMEVQASIARYLIKDAFDNARAEAHGEERALRLQVQELVQKTEDLKGKNEKLKTSLVAAEKEKKEAQEKCIQEAEKLELLHTRYTRVEPRMWG